MSGECIRCKHGDFEPFPYGDYICLCKKSEHYGKEVEYEDSCACYEEIKIDEEYEVDFGALHDSINIKGFGQGNQDT